MTQIAALPGSGKRSIDVAQRNAPSSARRGWAPWLALVVSAIAAVFVVPVALAATPAAGDAYVYRLVNGYNGETVGKVRHEITGANTAQGVVATVTSDTPSLGPERTEIYTTDGQWLRRPLDNHGINVDYEFAPALPTQKSGTTRVNAKVPSENASRSVRIDSQVLGNERIRVPAGEFDTIKIQRIIYAGDRDYIKGETRINETKWYSPTIGRTVRSETRSGWRQLSCSARSGTCDFRGDWHVLELTEAPATKAAR